jgi:hypothetical protein
MVFQDSGFQFGEKDDDGMFYYYTTATGYIQRECFLLIDLQERQAWELYDAYLVKHIEDEPENRIEFAVSFDFLAAFFLFFFFTTTARPSPTGP